jgi:hypothetical protein
MFISSPRHCERSEAIQNPRAADYAQAREDDRDLSSALHHRIALPLLGYSLPRQLDVGSAQWGITDRKSA